MTYTRLVQIDLFVSLFMKTTPEIRENITDVAVVQKSHTRQLTEATDFVAISDFFGHLGATS